jgi:hypothetical protein
MGVTTQICILAALAGGLAAAVPHGAAAQQTPPPKPSGKPPQPDATAGTDLFLPPMRGNPDGRISGGTRGLDRPAPSWSTGLRDATPGQPDTKQ